LVILKREWSLSKINIETSQGRARTGKKELGPFKIREKSKKRADELGHCNKELALSKMGESKKKGRRIGLANKELAFPKILEATRAD